MRGRRGWGGQSGEQLRVAAVSCRRETAPAGRHGGHGRPRPHVAVLPSVAALGGTGKKKGAHAAWPSPFQD